MSKVDDRIREEHIRTLNSLKKRRAVLDKDIAGLEHVIEYPTPPLHIDFEAMDQEARKDMEFLDQCERIRKGEWVSS